MRKDLLALGLLVQLVSASGCDDPPPQARATPTPSATDVVRVNAYVCDVAYKPATVLIACGDGNARVTALHWTTWGAKSATATGTWQQNDCVPDCARGKFHDYPVRLTLTQPIEGQGTRIFGTVEAQFPGTSPNGRKRVLLMRDGRYAP